VDLSGTFVGVWGSTFPRTTCAACWRISESAAFAVSAKDCGVILLLWSCVVSRVKVCEILATFLASADVKASLVWGGFFSQVPQKCTILDLSLLYILVFGTYGKLAWKNNFLAPGVYFVQPCSSAGHRFAASRSRLQYYRRIDSFPQPDIRWNAL